MSRLRIRNATIVSRRAERSEVSVAADERSEEGTLLHE
ncbi:MAG: hypothetical protein QOI63_108 [Thermoplasmata archaeon]|jgi:hypothetical protein|nr:hypothetical protein [Thermoplasmata archaeon]